MTVVYIKPELSMEVTSHSVYLRDVASIYCAEKRVEELILETELFRFLEKQEVQVISALFLMEKIEEKCPEVLVINVGEQETIVTLLEKQKEKKGVVLCKVVFAALVSFFGTSFTIMAFHNDIGIHKLFTSVYEILMGKSQEGYSFMEVSYSLGLSLGILLFFNHFGGKKLTKDPTPIEVEMRIYEEEVNKALIEEAEREGKAL